jgi:CXXC-20-CXXC protein
MRVCSKCNAKIDIVSILKSSWKRAGLIECDKCHAKFKIKGYLPIIIILTALSFITVDYLIIYYSPTLINYSIKGIILVATILLVYTGLAFLLPWKEE